MTWHAKALTDFLPERAGRGREGAGGGRSGVSVHDDLLVLPGRGRHAAAADTQVIVAFGDSITDGTASTLNGDDRWPNALARRLHAAYGDRVAVVNAGIGGNQVAGPAEYSAAKPFAGGPSARQRLERDVLSLSGVTTVIWLEGINDFSNATNAAVEAVDGGHEGSGRRSCKARGVRVIGATVVSALGSTNAAHGSAEEDRKRQELNEFIRTSGMFDGVVDFDKATADPRDRRVARRSSSRTARPAARGTSCIRIGRDIWRWRWPSI